MRLGSAEILDKPHSCAVLMGGIPLACLHYLIYGNILHAMWSALIHVGQDPSTLTIQPSKSQGLRPPTSNYSFSWVLLSNYVRIFKLCSDHGSTIC